MSLQKSKEEALKRVNEIEKELQELKDIINAPEEKDLLDYSELERYNDKNNCLTIDFSQAKGVWESNNFNYNRFNNYSVFKDKETAEKVAKKYIAENKLRWLADKMNSDDFKKNYLKSGNIEKKYFCFDINNEEVCLGTCFGATEANIFFEKGEYLKKVREILGDEVLLDYFMIPKN